jgi:hypothetical protein
MSSRIQLKNPEASAARIVKVRFLDVILVASRGLIPGGKNIYSQKKNKGFQHNHENR